MTIPYRIANTLSPEADHMTALLAILTTSTAAMTVATFLLSIARSR